ncbi:MAG: tetratricopeptide repeat protein [Anaerolineales bacterium]
MILDPENPIVRLCADGMQAEFQGRFADAQRLFQQAWDTHRDDLEACIAAHYLARHQETPAETLHWNQLALDYAQKSVTSFPESEQEDSLAGFFPSLYLNMGWSYEQLNNRPEAARYYHMAAAALDQLPASPYRETVAEGIQNGLERLAASDLGA